MGKQYDNNNSGALFPNENRTKDTHPHYRGTATLGNKEFWVSAWSKKSAKGKSYVSLAFTEKEDQPGAPDPDVDPFLNPTDETKNDESTETKAGEDDFVEDDIPF